MRQEAEIHADEDRQRKEAIELHNTADSAAYHADKLLKEHEDKIDAELQTEVQAKIQAVRDALAAEPKEPANLQAAVDALNEALMRVGQKVYQRGRAGGRRRDARPRPRRGRRGRCGRRRISRGVASASLPRGGADRRGPGPAGPTPALE